MGEKKGKERTGMTLLSPCYLTAAQASLPKTWKLRMSEGGSGYQMSPLILRGEFYHAAPSVRSGMLSTSIAQSSIWAKMANGRTASTKTKSNCLYAA